jgi:hypothetical protein
MIYIMGVILLACFSFLGYIMYCDISLNKKEKTKKQDVKIKK